MGIFDNADLLYAAIDFLDRCDLEVLEITSVSLRDIVRKHYINGPYRHFYRLDVRGAESTLISEDEFNEEKGKFNATKLWHYKSLDVLCSRLRNSVVDFVDFSNVVLFDESLLNAMMAVKSAWSRGTCRTADVFVSGEVLEKAFDQLFNCQEMLMSIQPVAGETGCSDCSLQLAKLGGTDLVFSLSKSVLALDAVKRCVRLEIWHAPYPYSAQDLVNWLTCPTPFGDNKTLRIMPSGFGYTGQLQELTNAIKEASIQELTIINFANAEMAARFEMQIILKKSNITKPVIESMTNKFTSEELHISIHPPHRFHQATKLIVQRKPRRVQHPKPNPAGEQKPEQLAQHMDDLIVN